MTKSSGLDDGNSPLTILVPHGHSFKLLILEFSRKSKQKWVMGRQSKIGPFSTLW